MDTQDIREIIKDKLRQNFAGKIVRKDLTKKIKEGANVPVYVLEFLLGQYCSSDDPGLSKKALKALSIFWQIILYGRMKRRRFCRSCVSVAIIQ